jgi:hypothetical protein
MELMHTEFWFERWKERNELKYQEIGERVLLNCILEENDRVK